MSKVRRWGDARVPAHEPAPSALSSRTRPERTKGAVDRGALRTFFGCPSRDEKKKCRRDESRRPSRRCLGGTPLSGVSLRPNGRTPPGSRCDFQTDGPPPFSGTDQLTAFGRRHQSLALLGLRPSDLGEVRVALAPPGARAVRQSLGAREQCGDGKARI